MKVSVCASFTYYYDVEVSDKLCELDNDGYLKNEADLLMACVQADPAELSGTVNNVVCDIISIRTEESDEEIYYS